jgi:hypothetical protein
MINYTFFPIVKSVNSNFTYSLKNNSTNTTNSKIKKFNSRKNSPKLSTQNNYKNSSTYNKTFFMIHNLTLLDIDFNHLDLLTHYFKDKNDTEKQKLCKSCLNQVEVLKFLQNEIKVIREDIFKFVNKTASKQDLVAKLSDQVNKINIIKINIHDIQPTLDLMKKINCTNFKENQKKFKATIKKAAGLVESLQNSIRKSNLNTNFLIIS